MTETKKQGIGPEPEIFVQGEPGVSHPGAAAVICRAGTTADLEVDVDEAEVIWLVAAGFPPPSGARICVAEGLAASTALAADHPDLAVIPRASVRRATHRYGFNALNDGSGFSTYHLDPATVSAFSVAEDEKDVPLGDWLKQAAALGFDRIWLHGLDAEEAGRGFPCDMLAKSHRITPETRFWISGGGCRRVHFETISPMPGLAVLVVDTEVLKRLDRDANAASISAPVSTDRAEAL